MLYPEQEQEPILTPTKNIKILYMFGVSPFFNLFLYYK